MFFLTSTDANEISFIAFSLDSYKSSGPNSILVEILKFSQQLKDTFRMSFRIEKRHYSVLKIAKVMPIHRSNQKLIT